MRSEQSRILRGQVFATPFRALAVENLLRNGFVRPDDEGSFYYAPDAGILLSDPFLDTHCMSLEEGKDEAEGLIGLSFEPTEDRGVTDISGVLWLDPDPLDLDDKGDAAVTKAAIEPVWYLPGMADRFGIAEADLRSYERLHRED